jgi:hypothetical protein
MPLRIAFGAGEMILITLIILAVTFLIVVPLLRQRAQMEKPKRDLIVGDDGEIVRIGERARGKPVTLSGQGAHASDALELDSGVYRIAYRFPPEVLIAVKLIAVDDAEEHAVLVKRGEGSHTFSVETAGRYVVQVEPQDDHARWEVEYRRL